MTPPGAVCWRLVTGPVVAVGETRPVLHCLNRICELACQADPICIQNCGC